MERFFKNITDTEQELVISLSKSEVQPNIDAAYKDVTKKVQLDGFRPGKAPLHLIKKMYGASIESEEFLKLADKYIPEILKEEDIFVVSQPHLHDINKKDDGVELVVHYHYIPKFDIQDYKGITADEPTHTVSDEEINNFLEDASFYYCTYQDDEIVADVNYKIEVCDHSVEIADGTEKPKFPVVLRDKRIIKELGTQFIDKKVGDFVDYEFPQTEKDLANGIEKKVLKLEILKIEKMIPREFDEEFVKQVSQDKFTSLDDYKEEVGFTLQQNWDKESRDILENNIIGKLIEMHDIKLPDVIIREQAQKMYDEDNKNNKTGGLKFEQLSSTYMAVAANVIKWDLIREKIIELEKLEVEDYDIDEFIDKNLNYPNLDKELIRKTVVDNKQFINSILVRKVMDFLIDFTNTTEVDFNEEQKIQASFIDDSFVDDFDDDEEEDDIFDADEEFIDEEEFDGEFFEDDEVDDFDEEDEFEVVDEDEEDEEEDDEDDEDASKK